jgi:hypothetical protein
MGKTLGITLCCLLLLALPAGLGTADGSPGESAAGRFGL